MLPTLQGHEGEEIELWAYSNCDEVELTVNGEKLGRQPMSRYGHLKWKAVYQPGKVVATGYKNGKRIMVLTMETTKPASKIGLSNATFPVGGRCPHFGCRQWRPSIFGSRQPERHPLQRILHPCLQRIGSNHHSKLSPRRKRQAHLHFRELEERLDDSE